MRSDPKLKQIDSLFSLDDLILKLHPKKGTPGLVVYLIHSPSALLGRSQQNAPQIGTCRLGPPILECSSLSARHENHED